MFFRKEFFSVNFFRKKFFYVLRMYYVLYVFRKFSFREKIYFWNFLILNFFFKRNNFS